MDDQQDSGPFHRQPLAHRADSYGLKFVEKSGKAFDKAQGYKQKSKTTDGAGDSDKKEKQPAGGFDDTPIPYAPHGYTLKFTFHRATNLPFADINSLSSDPYVEAVLTSSLPKRHKQDPDLKFRTPTIRRNLHPEWNCEWVVANVPASGFRLKARLYDEDPADHDDKLGNVEVEVLSINKDWVEIKEQAYKIKKRAGSKRAYFIRGCAAIISRKVHMDGSLVLSVENLGQTDGPEEARMWTVGPNYWSQHFSPLIGRLAGTKEPDERPSMASEKPQKRKAQRYNFQANQIQLSGPIPGELYHRYVEFKPFVAGMFTSHSLRGRILNRALHHQHARIYNYDRDTIYGMERSPSPDLTLQFLKLVHFDIGARIFTYVITLDSLWRFTETGKEFGIDLLSKHTMHSDVSIYIAFSGEFFIRRLHHRHQDPDSQPTHPPDDISGGPPSDEPPQDPAYYELIIDNDSGTYRPNAKLLPLLKSFLHPNFPGLKIKTLDCNSDAEEMGKLKTEQRDRKKKEGGGGRFKQTSFSSASSSISSSDEEDLDRLEGVDSGRFGKLKREMQGSATKDRIREWVARGAGEDHVVVERADGKVEEIPVSELQNGNANGNASGDASASASASASAQKAPATDQDQGQGNNEKHA
ncbi:MAG: hypothetical protein M1834_003600 [Cirrosporium novae-zelandiae]|nr:MAG: hypothetical protein M1834_003600 [Cirrosporium novae-zelandiae]